MSTSEKPWYSSALIGFLTIDVPDALGLPPGAFARDVKTLERRLTFEGESFLNKTLPELGRAIDLALQERQPLISRAFRKKGPGDARPAFLWALHRRCFSETGWLQASPCITSIRLLRQVCNWFKKIEKGFSDEQLQRDRKSVV